MPEDNPARPICFVMTPFGDWYDQYYSEIHKPAIEAAELKPRRADDLYGPSPIIRDIWALIRECHVGLADLTHRNPNVLYELGLAHAITKPVVLVSETLEDVPFDLRALRTITYDRHDASWSVKLKSNITVALREVAAKPSAMIPLPFVSERPSGPPIHVNENERRQISIEQQLSAIAASVARLTAPPASGPSVVRPHRPQAMGLARLYEGHLGAYIFRRLSGEYEWAVENRKDKVVIADGKADTLEEAQRQADAAAQMPPITDWQAHT